MKVCFGKKGSVLRGFYLTVVSRSVSGPGESGNESEGTKWWRGIKADLRAENISGEKFRNSDWRKEWNNFLKKGRDGRVDDWVETSDSECEFH